MAICTAGRPWAVRGDRQAGGVCLVHHGLQLILGELAQHHLRACGREPAAGHHLDDVRAPRGALAHRGPQLLLARGFAAHAGTVTTGAGDRRSRRQHGWVAGIVGGRAPLEHGEAPVAQVPDGRHPGRQVGAQALADDGLHAVLARLVDPVQGPVCAVSTQVNVRVDQSRQHRAAGHLQDLAAVRHGRGPRFHPRDTHAVEQDERTARYRPLPVERRACPDAEHRSP
jgi:hypothetical protein